MTMKYFKPINILSLLIIFLISCGGSGDDGPMERPEPESIIPSDLVLEITLIGSDENNQNGDGSGTINCIATASNAVKYIFKFGDGTGTEIESTTGTVEYSYIEQGTNPQTVFVYAYSSTGNYINTYKQLSVFVTPDTFDDLVWSDEFDVEGNVSSANWKFETYAPNNGSWWNGELQHYTDRSDNAFVSDGTLKIVAKKESYTSQGVTHQYTSARMNSVFAFTYGRVDVRAKLPKGEGTWPAIWMLGSNHETVGWPACGEIDIMEHWGHVPEVVSSATHKPSCYGDCNTVGAGETRLKDYATAFHVYSLEWTQDELRFLIDDVYKYSYKPSVKNDDTWPYFKDQFLILNVAMGGSWFSVDPNFTESTMEIDYIRVYQ